MPSKMVASIVERCDVHSYQQTSPLCVGNSCAYASSRQPFPAASFHPIHANEHAFNNECFLKIFVY